MTFSCDCGITWSYSLVHFKGSRFLKENGVIIDIDVIINNLFTKSHLIIVQLWKSEAAATLRSKLKKNKTLVTFIADTFEGYLL